MDVDAETRRPLLSYFDVSPNQFAWREPRVEQIEHRRATLGDLLIFDILLTRGGIREPDTLYPPVDATALERLLDAIESSTYDALKKECLIYFLLKWHQDGREERYRDERCIPPQFTALADAYWHLDGGVNIPRAVSILSDCRLNRDYSSKILQAISLAPNSTPLVLRYIRTAKPPLIEPDDINTYTLALAETSFLEAWQYQRTFNEKDETRTQLFRKLLEWAVTTSARAQPLTQLLALPLSPFEESLLHQFTLEPPETISQGSLAILQDLVCVRLVQSGRTIDAIKMDRQYLASTTKNTNNEPRSQERTAMVQELRGALPRPERIILESELERITEGGAFIKPRGTSPPQDEQEGEDEAMAHSWEEIRLPPSLNQSTVVEKPQSVAAIPERSGAPRFGGPIPPSAAKETIQSLTVPVRRAPPAAPRKSLPLPSAPSAFSFGQPRKSLGADFQLRPTSSPITPKPANIIKPTTVFESATQRPNAFYTPPSKTNDADSPFTPAAQPDDNAHSDVEQEEMDVNDHHGDVSMEDDAVSHLDQDEPEEQPQEEQPSHLGFSVFGKSTLSTSRPAPVEEEKKEVETEPRPKTVPTPHISAATATTATANEPISAFSISSNGGKKAPPGALFVEEEEPEEEHEWQPPQPPAAEASISASHPSMRRKSKDPEEPLSGVSNSASSRTRAGKERAKRKSIPGSLMMEDDDDPQDASEEEEDRVAPLRVPSPPRRALRKGRSVTSIDVAEEQQPEAAKTRRRSTRLSMASSLPNVASPPASPVKRRSETTTTAIRGRKSTATKGGTTGRKKRS